MAPHSSTLAWKTPRMEEPGGLQSMARDSQESSPTPQFKSINSSVLSFLMVQLSHPYMTLLEKP